MRRPAAIEGAGSPWSRGEVCKFKDVPLEDLTGAAIIITEGDYFGAKVEVAAQVTKAEVEDGDRHLLAQVTGTTSEVVLKQVTSTPTTPFKIHLCQSGCGLHVTGDHYLHALQGRKRKAPEELTWVDNLLAARGAGGDGDELRQLRARADELARGGPPGRSGVPPGPLDIEGQQQAVGEEASKRKKKKKKDRRAADFLDGRRASKAVTKDLALLFGGTGLDPRERVRRRVIARAQKLAAKKKSRKETSSSSSQSSSSSSPSLVEGQGTDGVFTTDSKARGVSERYPGALTLETITTMRRSLLTTAGEEAEERSTKPVALLYYRNQLTRRATGAQARELLNLATALDHLLRGKVAMAADVISQRMKAQQAVLHGTHWSIAQRMELPLPEESTLVAQAELQLVQKENYDESRARWLSQGGQTGGKKGDAKGSGKSKTSKGERAEWPKDGKREEQRKGKEKGNEKK